MKPVLSVFFIAITLCSFSQTDTSRLVSYVNSAYKIEYPASWTIDTSKKMGSEFFLLSPVENAGDKFRENVNLIVQNLSGKGIDMDKYVEISEDQIKNMGVNGQINESKRIENSGSGYHKMVFVMSQGVFNLKVEQYYFIEKEKAYIITFTAESDKFDAYKTAGEKILNSFVLKSQ
ncbi:MAG: hypothetical protein JNK14_08590 [Chitinophagaceae bacterium]|nr:hypothetical protein [Chitinophagaceae bacterium]